MSTDLWCFLLDARPEHRHVPGRGKDCAVCSELAVPSGSGPSCSLLMRKRSRGDRCVKVVFAVAKDLKRAEM